MVVAVDIGTTSTKVLAVARDGQVRASATHGYPLDEPHPGWAEQDAGAILGAVRHGLRDVVRDRPGPVDAVAMSAAMHGLLGLDADGAPVTPVLTWADNRAAEQARRIRSSAGGLELHRRTGTPVHPMAPLAKLAWFHDEAPEVARRVACWAGAKEHVLRALTGRLVTDFSLASATGLLDERRGCWDEEGLALAHVSPDQLPDLVATTTVLTGLTDAGSRETGLPAGTRVVVGAGDGPLANLGLGAVAPGVAACSIGTSGALRVMVEQPGVDAAGSVFCYALADDRWVVGGAVNNGGVVLEWAGDALTPEARDAGRTPQLLLDEAAAVPPGSDGLLMLPQLLGERAPRWDGVPLGAYVGLTREHRRGHLVRAAIEGVCLQLALVLDAVRDAGNEVHEVRATGGFARSTLWCQVLADVLGMPVRLADGNEGSALGAALLGMHATGALPALDDAVDLVRMGRTVQPDRAAARRYAALRPVYAQAEDALAPTFRDLRRLTADD